MGWGLKSFFFLELFGLSFGVIFLLIRVYILKGKGGSRSREKEDE